MRLIDADALGMKLDDSVSLNELSRREHDLIMNAIKYAPTIDAKPIIHATWIGGELGKCSACHCKGCASDIWNDVESDGYCPNCGALMDGKAK